MKFLLLLASLGLSGVVLADNQATAKQELEALINTYYEVLECTEVSCSTSGSFTEVSKPVLEFFIELYPTYVCAYQDQACMDKATEGLRQYIGFEGKREDDVKLNTAMEMCAVKFPLTSYPSLRKDRYSLLREKYWEVYYGYLKVLATFNEGNPYPLEYPHVELDSALTCIESSVS